MARRLMFLIALLVPFPTLVADDASFTGLGFLPGGAQSSAIGVSADGRVVVGQGMLSMSIVTHAFRWTAQGGIEDLGCFGERNFTSASGVSADGMTVVGAAFRYLEPEPESLRTPFRWTEAEGFQIIPPRADGVAVFVQDLSADGRTLVGSSGGPAFEAMVWRWSNSGDVTVSTLPSVTDSNHGGARAMAISDDGSFVVGQSPATFNGQPVRWATDGGVQSLGSLPGLSTGATRDVSSNGSVAVGFMRRGTSDDYHAFRWNEGLGMMDLMAPCEWSTFAETVSGDGRVVVGEYFDRATEEGGSFIWTESSGVVDLRSVLRAAGANVTGWRLDVATSLSADGRVIVGSGRNSNDQQEGWIAHLDSIPTDCLADWNNDGALDSQDFFDFLESFFAGDGDFNWQCGADSQDLFDFLESYFSGC